MLTEKRVTSPRGIALAGIIAAVYAALAMLLAPISFNALQFRVSEALCVLPLFTPAAIPGLFIGCLVTNILGPYGPWDIVLGSLATLLSALGTYWLREKPILALWPPVILNALIIGGMLAVMTQTSFWINAGLLFAEQTGACVVFGRLLYMALRGWLMKR